MRNRGRIDCCAPRHRRRDPGEVALSCWLIFFSLCTGSRLGATVRGLAKRGGNPMPLDSLEFRTSLQKLLVGLILILVPLTVFGFYVALQGDSYVRQMSGENFRSLTRTAAESTSEFIAG